MIIEQYIFLLSVIKIYRVIHIVMGGGSRLPCAQTLFHNTAGKFRWRRKLNRKFALTC